MLLKKDLIESLGEEYAPMINQISIADFTKCVAYYAGLNINQVSDDAIEDYLKNWALHKKHFFEMLGNKTRVDTKITYESQDTNDYEQKYHELALEYPVYAPWFSELNYPRKNKIENLYSISWEFKNLCKKYFPHYTLEGSTITHFFKKCLNAPEDIINKIASFYEFNTITSNFTISIDPVDMMLASENPYNWRSCYRLDPTNDASHADGCLAAVLDSTSLITYAWNKSGDYLFEDSCYTLKNVRYKRMREWISINNTFDAIHFNTIYPGKYNYPAKFNQQWRNIVETYVANYLEKENIWKRNELNGYNYMYDCERFYSYGYGEWDNESIYYLKDRSEDSQVCFSSYDTEIICPCGCGCMVPGTDDDSDYSYCGGGLTFENFGDRWEEEEYEEEEEYDEDEEEEYDADERLREELCD